MQCRPIQWEDKSECFFFYEKCFLAIYNYQIHYWVIVMGSKCSYNAI